MELENFEKAKEIKEELNEMLRLNSFCNNSSTLVDVLCRSKANIDMDNEPDVKLAFKIIETKAVDTKNISEIGEEALLLNPEINREIEPYHNPINNDKVYNESFQTIFK